MWEVIHDALTEHFPIRWEPKTLALKLNASDEWVGGMNGHKIRQRCSEFYSVFPVIAEVINESSRTQRIEYRGVPKFEKYYLSETLAQYRCQWCQDVQLEALRSDSVRFWNSWTNFESVRTLSRFQ